MLTPHARRYFVAETFGTTRTSSCKIAAAHMFKLGGASVSATVHARLLHVAVSAHTATTVDTSSPFKEHWALTRKDTWKVSELAPGADV
jgi:hypothetical protein